MKRIIEFNYQDDEFFLQENGNRIFSIKASDLKFNSVDFYTGVYKNKSAYVELNNKISSDPHKKCEYIFAWLSEIVASIANEFHEDAVVEEELPLARVIPLYEFAACAGDGFFVDNNIPHSEIPDTTGTADFAVTVSGKSMEPTIKDKSVIFVKKAEEADHNEIGLFVVDGEVMCKRYVKQGRGFKLVPENKDFDTILGKTITTITYLGKVII